MSFWISLTITICFFVSFFTVVSVVILMIIMLIAESSNMINCTHTTNFGIWYKIEWILNKNLDYQVISYLGSILDECWIFCSISDLTNLELAFPNGPSLNPSISWVETSNDSSLYSSFALFSFPPNEWW